MEESRIFACFLITPIFGKIQTYLCLHDLAILQEVYNIEVTTEVKDKKCEVCEFAKMRKEKIIFDKVEVAS